MLGNALMDLTASGAPVLFPGVEYKISTHSAREVAVLEGEGGSKKRKKTGGKAPRKGTKKK
jgi:hypothetical protein